MWCDICNYYQAFDLALLAIASIKFILTSSARPIKSILKTRDISLHDLGDVSSSFRRPTISTTIPPERKNLVPLYITKICVISIILSLQIAEWIFLAQERTTDVWERPWPVWISDVRTSSAALSCMYTGDMLYQSNMRRHIQIHHLLAIGLILYMTHLLESTHLPVFRDTGLLWLLQGTTEQLTLLGLIGLKRRWSPKYLSKLFLISSLQTGMIKFGSLILVMLRWNQHLATLPDTSGGAGRWWVSGNGMWVFALGLVYTQILQALSIPTTPSTDASPSLPIPTPTKPIPIQTFQVVLTEREKMIKSQVVENMPIVEITDIEVVL